MSVFLTRSAVSSSRRVMASTMTNLSSGQSSIAVSASVGSSSNQYHNRFFTTEEPVDKDKSLYYISQDEPEVCRLIHRENVYIIFYSIVS